MNVPPFFFLWMPVVTLISFLKFRFGSFKGGCLGFWNLKSKLVTQPSCIWNQRRDASSTRSNYYIFYSKIMPRSSYCYFLQQERCSQVRSCAHLTCNTALVSIYKTMFEILHSIKIKRPQKQGVQENMGNANQMVINPLISNLTMAAPCPCWA